MKNYHTHTARCRHASGNAIDYAREAVSAGITVLGISDHTPLPDGRWQDVRMRMDELPAYRAEIEAAASGSLTVLASLECEDFPEYRGFYRDELLGRYGMHYLVGGNHYFRMDNEMHGVYLDERPGADSLNAYATHVIAAIESGLYAFMAHPDLFGYFYLAWDDEAKAVSHDICAASRTYGVPLEINGYGMRKKMIDTPDGPRRPYPLTAFWEIAAREQAPVVINSDAHRPEDVAAGIPEGYALARRLGLRIADVPMYRPR